MSKYAIVIEREPGNQSLGAYVPDLPGCVAVAKSESELLLLINEAIDLHLESLRDHGEPIPTPRTKVMYSRKSTV